jgi:dUTP pyrophosphatase
MKVKIKKLHRDAKIPEYKSVNAAGCDIYALEETVIKPRESVLVRTGIAIEFDKGYFAILAPRSSFALKNNLDIPNSIGIGDSDYRGEYLMAIRNLGDKEVIVEKHERIGQFIFVPFVQARFEEVESLGDTQRGSGGFGSSGKF